MPATVLPETRPPLALVNPPSLAIEAHGLTRTYETFTAVDALDLGIRTGEVYGFLGPNGAGKTTTLRMLLGLITPTSGTISILGHKPGTPDALARIGSMIETPAFYPFLSGRDNLGMLAAYTGTPAERIDVVLQMVDLANRAGDAFRTYSLGMKQRLGVAAALLKDPPLLVLDEPTNGLDPAGMADMRRLIRRLGNEGHTVLLSSHLMPEVEKVCDRIGIIARGRLVFEGTVDDLRGDPALIVRVDDPLRARSLLLAAPGVTGIDISGAALRLSGNDLLDPSAVNATLVGAGIAVRELRSDRRSLEEMFLALTGEEERHAI
ncbi:MAG TPA: ABC transporter ATP-binding protein [Thermomicrobiales bacterium]|nr:ABC transporter ATP-binding protein [Thermomicrobiales bacterium]